MQKNNLLIDESLWCQIKDLKEIVQSVKKYQSVALAKGSIIQQAQIYEQLCSHQKQVIGENIFEFLYRHQRLYDLENWAYMSQNISNIRFMIPYMDCFTFGHNVTDVTDTYGMPSKEEVQKIFK